MPDDDVSTGRIVLQFLSLYWRQFILVIWPFLSLIVFFCGFESKIRCLYVVVLMAGYWVFECVPLYVTGMLPIFLMPMLQVQDTGGVCLNYFNKTNMLFLLGMFVAAMIEHCGLHNRIALGTMRALGCSPRKLHFSLTFVTMFLSMFLINSATTAMMCPIIHAVLQNLEEQGVMKIYLPKEVGQEDEPPRPTTITVAFFLTTAYASNIGGTGCLVGTGTNLTYKGLFETRFPTGTRIEFLTWMLFNIPSMLVSTLLMWLSLQVQLMGMFRPNSEEYDIVKKGTERKDILEAVIKERYESLGPLLWKEIGVLILFVALVILWLFRKPQFILGWGDLLTVEKVADATPAVLILFLAMSIPASFSCIYFCGKDKSLRPTKNEPSLITWKAFNAKMPWGLLFLLGGGFALSDAGRKSGMSQFLGEQLVGMSSIPPVVVLGITSMFASIATEMTSNVAICNIVVPILIEMSAAMKVHPILFTYSAAVCCSFAFLLPVGTPPNAIIMEEGNVKTIDLMKYGLLTKLATWLVVCVLFLTYGRVFFPDMDSLPKWASSTNSTS